MKIWKGRNGRASRAETGFTIVDLLLIVALVGIVSAAAYPVITSTLDYYRTESALQLVLANVREARQSAIDERRSYRITFSYPGSFAVWKQDDAFAWVQERQIFLPFGISFHLPSGIPRISIIDNSADIDFNGGNTCRFRADGSVVNSSGRIVSGIVYISNSAETGQCRAVSVFGGTGLTRAWVYENGQWN